VNRRTLLKGAAAGAAGLSLGPAFWRTALAKPARPGPGPYGSLRSADANGLMLPDGFTSRVVGLSGTPVLGTSYVWHLFPDGAATFPLEDGGWVLVSNSEVPAPNGGAGAIKFAVDGSIVDAYRILDGTGSNCAGGPTPWGTWLSCEETDTGLVWECDVHQAGQGVARPALGTFSHEAAAVDPERGHVYLTEDAGDSLLYRFTPSAPGDLTEGVLEAARHESNGSVTWLPVPDPSGGEGTPTRHQIAGATTFRRGEGMWFDRDTAYFTTTSDDRVWAYHCDTNHLEVVYDAAASEELPLHDPDNITVHHPSGDLFVAEDPDNLELVLITRPGGGGRVAAPFLRVDGHPESEISGPVFDPTGTRLYVSSQRGGVGPLSGPGVTYEITGPFRGWHGNKLK
jgi:uncharacterized protein